MGPPLRTFLLLLSFCVPLLLSAQIQQLKLNPDTTIHKLERQIYAIDPENGEYIPVYFVQLDEIKIRIDTLITTINKLNISDNLLLNRLTRAKHYFDSVQPLVLSKMQRIDLVMYDEALKARIKGDSTRSNTLFIRSLQHNPFYGPSAFELIKLNLVPEKALQAVQYYESYGTHIDSISNPYYFNLIRDLTPQVLDNIIASSEKMIVQGIPSDALNILKDAGYFNTMHPSLHGSLKIKVAFTSAHTGMYKALIIIAERAFSSKKWDLAKYYYNKAKEYQQLNSDYLADDLITQKGLDKTISEAEKSLLLEKTVPRVKKRSTKRKSRTHHYYTRKPKAEKYKKSSSVIAIKDTMAAYYISLADSSLKHRQYYSCLGWCDSAVLINTEKHSIGDSTINMLYGKAARIIILDSVHAAYYFTWKNEITQAVRTLNMAEQYRIKYHLLSDNEVTNAIEELRNRIKERKCFSTKSEYEANVYRALSRFIRADFLDGRDYLVKARVVLQNNLECNQDDSLLVRTEQQYHGIIQWQEHWNEAKQSLSVKDYQTFYDEYNFAYNVYIIEKLENKGLIFRPLTQYIEDIKDTVMAREAVIISLDKGKIKDAWTLLMVLKNNGVKAKFIENLMIKTGNQMAIQDQADKSTYWANQLKSAGSWFKKAKKSYFRRLKDKTS